MYEWSLERIRNQGRDSRRTMMDRADAIGIMQNEFTLTSGHRPFKFIKTTGVGPCVAVGLYEAESKVGAFMHLAGTSDVFWALNASLSRMRSLGVDTSSIVAGAIGGEEGRSESVVLRALDALESKQIRVGHLDVLHDPFSRTSVSLIFDTFDGTYYDMTPTATGYIPLPDRQSRDFFALMGDRIQFRRDPNGLGLA